MTDKERAKAVRRASRKIHAGMKTGGAIGSKKGKRGYTRKAKHAHCAKKGEW